MTIRYLGMVMVDLLWIGYGVRVARLASLCIRLYAVTPIYLYCRQSISFTSLRGRWILIWSTHLVVCGPSWSVPRWWPQYRRDWRVTRIVWFSIPREYRSFGWIPRRWSSRRLTLDIVLYPSWMPLLSTYRFAPGHWHWTWAPTLMPSANPLSAAPHTYWTYVSA